MSLSVQGVDTPLNKRPGDVSTDPVWSGPRRKVWTTKKDLLLRKTDVQTYTPSLFPLKKKEFSKSLENREIVKDWKWREEEE